jgi:hypothetical protein
MEVTSLAVVNLICFSLVREANEKGIDVLETDGGFIVIEGYDGERKRREERNLYCAKRLVLVNCSEREPLTMTVLCVRLEKRRSDMQKSARRELWSVESRVWPQGIAVLPSVR